MGKRIVCVILFLTLIFISLPGMSLKALEEEKTKETEQKIEEPQNLYAQSAVLMDADSGRILFAKNGQEERPMASTTKIMTCILALELGEPEEKVTVSKEAAVQPQVKLGMREGQTFYLKDLLYSLMLESHNDTAVAVAEHIAGSTEKFAEKMNEKAEELGCSHTYFITPNGLDGEDETGNHHTTAEELAVIMKYCITSSPKAKEFLTVTQMKEYSFSDCEGTAEYHCVNHNAFLAMMEGAISGKTGFTADAGYCYVGALTDGGRTFIVVLLACGWPNHKGYKWADTRKLMQYGLDNYQYRDVWKDLPVHTIFVQNGVSKTFLPGEKAKTAVSATGKECKLLLRKDEQITVEFKIPEEITAPVKKGSVIGKAVYSVGEEKLAEYEILAEENVEKRSFFWSSTYVFRKYFLNENA